MCYLLLFGLLAHFAACSSSTQLCCVTLHPNGARLVHVFLLAKVSGVAQNFLIQSIECLMVTAIAPFVGIVHTRRWEHPEYSQAVAWRLNQPSECGRRFMPM